MDPSVAEVVKLRLFAGLTMPEAADALGISVATAKRHWAFARTWLFAELNGRSRPAPDEKIFSGVRGFAAVASH